MLKQGRNLENCNILLNGIGYIKQVKSQPVNPSRRAKRIKVKPKRLSSLGVSRVDAASRSAKIEQLVEAPTWAQVKRKLTELTRAGLLTLVIATRNRIDLKWEPRVFAEVEILPQARESLQQVRYDLRLAFEDEQNRKEFGLWLTDSGLLRG